MADGVETAPAAQDPRGMLRSMAQRGFSLIEMVVAVAVLAILLAVAAPSFARQRASAAIDTATRQTLAAVHLARRLALARGQSVTVCASDDGSRCRQGGVRWMLFVNGPSGVESRREDGEELLRTWLLPEGIVVGGTRGYAAFQPRVGAASTVTFELRHDRFPSLGYDVVISQTGRPRVAARPAL